MRTQREILHRAGDRGVDVQPGALQQILLLCFSVHGETGAHLLQLGQPSGPSLGQQLREAFAGIGVSRPAHPAFSAQDVLAQAVVEALLLKFKPTEPGGKLARREGSERSAALLQ